jgi:hypothetical protein
VWPLSAARGAKFDLRTVYVVFDSLFPAERETRNENKMLKLLVWGRGRVAASVKPGSSGAGAFARELRFAALGGLAKRSFDILIAITALVVQTPIILAVAVFIHILIGKPVLFAQERFGFREGGRSLTTNFVQRPARAFLIGSPRFTFFGPKVLARRYVDRASTSCHNSSMSSVGT